MDEFDKCKFCLSYDSGYGCDDDICRDHCHYRIDVKKIIDKADERNISVTDVLNLIRECNSPKKRGMYV